MTERSGKYGPERNVRLTISYDGTGYRGWETQKNGIAIQEVIEKAIFKITGERVALEGSGRTDAGVHALGQVATFRFHHRIAAKKLVLAGPTDVPVEDRTAVAGIFIIDAKDKAEVDALLAGDPAIVAGRFEPVVLPWYGPAGITYAGAEP